MNLSTKSIVSVVLVFASIAAGYFVVLPRWTAYTEAQKATDALLLEQENLKTAQANLNNFLAEFRQHPETAAALNKALPLGKTDFHNILNNLDVLTKQSGLTLGKLSVEEKPDTDTLGALPNTIQAVDLSFAVSGTYATLQNFIQRLETNLRIIDVNTLTIHAGETASSMSFDMSFRTYYQK